jgi:ubiquinone/menaquinone biosynthesis C-methylase UbiE
MDYDKTELPSNYNRARELSGDAMRMWLDRLTTHIPTSEITSIIDLGCGTGRFSGALAKEFLAHVLGIDPSEKMLLQAGRKAVPENVAFVRGSGEWPAPIEWSGLNVSA